MGHEIRNIQKTADGAAYLFTPLESDVDFDEDSGDIYTVECDFAQKFALDVNALHCLTVNGIELYADSSTKSRVRVKVRPERISSAFALSENAMYTVHSRIEAVDVELPEEEKIEKYQIHNCYIGEHTLLKTLFQETIIELQLKKAYYDDIVLSSFLHMLVMIVRSRQQLLTSSENDFSIDRLVMQLNQHYMKDWTVSSMAKYCKLSVGYFSHIFKERMDAAPMHYLNDLRIEKAKELISTNTMKLSDVASMVGFSDSLYFSRVFKKTTGIPPKEYQQSLLTANTPNWWPDK